MASFHPSRHSHERNLEKSLEQPPDGPPLTGSAPAERGDAASGTDVASRLAREAAEREAVRRAQGGPERSGGS